jgi:hypothetical protein
MMGNLMASFEKGKANYGPRKKRKANFGLREEQKWDLGPFFFFFSRQLEPFLWASSASFVGILGLF